MTSEIRIVAPRYRTVAVQAALHLACGGDAAQVSQRARARLDAYFDPLTGGIDGLGWPFGGAVYRSEVLALLAGTDGVAARDGSRLHGRPRRVRPTVCDNVLLCANELVRAGPHRSDDPQRRAAST